MEDFITAQERFHRKLLIIGAIVVAVLAIAVLIGVKMLTRPAPPPYSRYIANDKEEVVYVGDVTEADARNLVERLKMIGFVTGNQRITLFLQKQSSQVTVSFIISTVVMATRGDEIERTFRGLGAGLKPLYPGDSLTIRLVDEKLKPVKDLKIE